MDNNLFNYFFGDAMKKSNEALKRMKDIDEKKKSQEDPFNIRTTNSFNNLQSVISGLDFNFDE